MTNPKSSVQSVSSQKVHVYLNLANFIRTVTQFDNNPSIESLTTSIRMWLGNPIDTSLSSKVLCINAKGAPENFNYLSLIRALTYLDTDKDVHNLNISGIVVGGIPRDQQYKSSILCALDCISHLTKQPYLLWTDEDGISHPSVRGARLTGNSAILFHRLMKILSEDYGQTFNYKILLDDATRSSGASAALKTLHNKYPALLSEQQIEVMRPDNKGKTTTYNYNLTGFKENAQTYCDTVKAVGT